MLYWFDYIFIFQYWCFNLELCNVRKRLWRWGKLQSSFHIFLYFGTRSLHFPSLVLNFLWISKRHRTCKLSTLYMWLQCTRKKEGNNYNKNRTSEEMGQQLETFWDLHILLVFRSKHPHCNSHCSVTCCMLLHIIGCPLVASVDSRTLTQKLTPIITYTYA